MNSTGDLSTSFGQVQTQVLEMPKTRITRKNIRAKELDFASPLILLLKHW